MNAWVLSSEFWVQGYGACTCVVEPKKTSYPVLTFIPCLTFTPCFNLHILFWPSYPVLTFILCFDLITTMGVGECAYRAEPTILVLCFDLTTTMGVGVCTYRAEPTILVLCFDLIATMGVGECTYRAEPTILVLCFNLIIWSFNYCTFTTKYANSILWKVLKYLCTFWNIYAISISC